MTNHNIRAHAQEACGCMVRGRVGMKVSDWDLEKESFVYSSRSKMTLFWE